MASAALAGFKAFLYVDDGGGAIKVGEARELTLDIEDELIDVSSHDSAPWREFISGLKTWTITAGVLHITGNAGQIDIRDAILAGTEMACELREEEGSGKPVWTGQVLMSSESLSFPNDDAMTGDITLQGTAALTEGTQT